MIYFGYTIIVLALIALLPVCFYIFYLFVLTLFSLIPKRKKQLKKEKCKFAVLIYASNEEKKIEETISAILANLDYPKEKFDIVVIADNCNDSTPFLSTFAGAEVLEYKNEWNVGKCYAFEMAFNKLKKSDYDAFLLLDIDSRLDNNVLLDLSTKIESGSDAIQLSMNSTTDRVWWRKRLFDVKLALNIHLQSIGRRNLGFSSHINKSGFCLTKKLIDQIEFKGGELIELNDYYYTLLDSDHKVDFISTARVATTFERKNELRAISSNSAGKGANSPLKVDDYIENQKYRKKILSKLIKEAFQFKLSSFETLLNLSIPSLKTLFLTLFVSFISGVVLLGSVVILEECSKLLIPTTFILILAILAFIMLLFYIFIGMIEYKIPFKTWLLVLFLPIVSIFIGYNETLKLLKRKS